MRKFIDALALISLMAIPTLTQTASAAPVSPSSSSLGGNGYCRDQGQARVSDRHPRLAFTWRPPCTRKVPPSYCGNDREDLGDLLKLPCVVAHQFSSPDAFRPELEQDRPIRRKDDKVMARLIHDIRNVQPGLWRG